MQRLEKYLFELLFAYVGFVEIYHSLVWGRWLAQFIVTRLIRLTMEGNSVIQEKHIEWLVFKELESTEYLPNRSVKREVDKEVRRNREKRTEIEYLVLMPSFHPKKLKLDIPLPC